MAALTVHSIARPRSTAVREPRATLLRTLGGGLARLAAEWRLRREIRSVEGFSDAMLQDIGLTRGSVEEAVRNGRASLGSPRCR